MSDDLLVPEGWTPTTLGKIGRYLNGRAFKTTEWSKTGRPIVRIQDLTGSNRNPNYFDGEVEDRYVVRPGDFLISWSATLGAFIWEGPEAVLNQHIFKVESNIDKQFHYHLVRERIAELERNAHGSGMVHVTKGIFDSTPVAVPDDIEVQRQLAHTIDQAEALRISSASHLSAARRTMERFRQAILAFACAGRLTEEWRQEHGLGEWSTERAEVACAKVQSGATPKTWYSGKDGVPFLKVYNIVDQKLDFDYRQQFITREQLEGPMARTTALPGDVLMNIVGPPLGKVAVVSDQYPAWSINQALTLFRPSKHVSTGWLYIFLASGISVADVMNQTRGTVGQVNISLTQCRNFEIPIPSSEEQQEIVRRVETLLAITDVIAQRIDRTQKKAELISESLLAKAFRGGLMTNICESTMDI